jgi:transcriptional regulator of arginine metabolism
MAAQATMSRDLARLGAVRTVGPDGVRYAIPGGARALPFEGLPGLVDAVSSNGALVVVRTKAGAASTVARAIDDAALRDALGTVAGDDTIFVAPIARGRCAALAARLRRLFR